MLGDAERLLLDRLKTALNPKSGTEETKESASDDSFWKAKESVSDDCFRKMAAIARQHAVLSFLFDVRDVEALSEEMTQTLKQAASITVRSNYRLLFLTKYITEFLEQNGIRAIILKGVATAAYYPVPELRKSGDVDILIPEEDAFLRACELLRQEGFEECEDQSALHHMELKNEEGISVEVHKILAEPFESSRINRYLEMILPEYEKNVEINMLWGVKIYQPTEAYHAFYLLIHMLQHFLRAGFGLKFLCDWVVFWNRDISAEEKEIFTRLMKDSGTEGFVTVLTEACVKYLGLRRENVDFLLEKPISEKTTESFMAEVFAAGEFGHGTKQRMVAMRGTGIFAYAREFHHQTRLNFPKAGKVFLLWPVLWVWTFWRFFYNNHTVRKVHGRDILKEAGRRSSLIHEMKLFS